MIVAWLFIFLYALLACVSLLLVLVWGHFAWERYRAIPSKPALLRDRYMLLACALMLDSFGMMITTGTRAVINCTHGLRLELYTNHGIWLALGLFVILVSKGLILWFVDLESKRPRWTWLKWFALLAIVIGASAIYATVQMPTPAELSERCPI